MNNYFIPRELRLSSFPQSFRYYDPILAIIKTQFPVESLEFLVLKKKVEQDFKNESILTWFLKKTGFKNLIVDNNIKLENKN